MKILFICTHNRCRSILSEAITNHLADGRITAYSAGSQPAGEVHPLSLKYLQQRGISIDGLQSQSWDDFEAIKPDVVITVCDSAANEACPVWFGNTAKVHWGLPDPSKLEGSEAEIQSAFNSVMDTIEIRVRGLLSLDIAAMSGAQLQTTLQQLAEEI
ncbi:arsenate reductase ArsC [Zhongshania guokunii]|uniref:Arsenate reductase ArsC n=1 Tax=Zhongshania guokunii TaxID=641783 RepID=A0ABV3U8F0_9GAMM